MEYISGILILVLSGFGMFSMLGFAEEKFAMPSELADEVDNLERLFQDVFDYDSNSFFSGPKVIFVSSGMKSLQPRSSSVLDSGATFTINDTRGITTKLIGAKTPKVYGTGTGIVCGDKLCIPHPFENEFNDLRKKIKFGHEGEIMIILDEIRSELATKYPNQSVKLQGNLSAVMLVAENYIQNSFPNIETKSEVKKKFDQIPDWIRNNAKWWSEEKIGDDDFISGIQFLIDNEIIRIGKTSPYTNSESQNIPSWIKNTAGFWGNDQISDIEFINTLEWLIENGILKISHSESMQKQDNCVIQTDMESLFPTLEQAGDMYRDDNYLFARNDGSMVFDGKIYKIHRKMYEKGIKIEISLIKFDSCDTALTYLHSEREADLRDGTIEDFAHNVKNVTECFGEKWPLKYVHTVMIKCVKDNVYFISSFPRGASNDLQSLNQFAQYVVDNFQ